MKQKTRSVQATYPPKRSSTFLEYWKQKNQREIRFCVAQLKRKFTWLGATAAPVKHQPSSRGRRSERWAGTSWRGPSSAGRCFVRRSPVQETRPPHPQGSEPPERSGCEVDWNNRSLLVTVCVCIHEEVGLCCDRQDDSELKWY